MKEGDPKYEHFRDIFLASCSHGRIAYGIWGGFLKDAGCNYLSLCQYLDGCKCTHPNHPHNIRLEELVLEDL